MPSHAVPEGTVENEERLEFEVDKYRAMQGRDSRR